MLIVHKLNLPLVLFLFTASLFTGSTPSSGQAQAETDLSAAAYRNIRSLPSDHDYFNIRGTADNSLTRFNRGGECRVAFLGGSITHNPGWREMVGSFLEGRFPEAEFDFINAGIPSMGSTPGAFRIKRDVLSRGPVDLLFVEAAVNDSTNGRSDREQVRAMEGILRQARCANPAVDVMFLYFADPQKTAAYNKGDIPAVIRNHEKVAEYYQVSSLNLALEVAERISARQFSWKEDFKDLHPSPFGQHLYGKSIKRMLQALWANPDKTASTITDHGMPADPLDPESYVNGRLIAVSHADNVRGWKFTDNWKPGDSASTREGFVNVPALEGLQPGDKIQLKFTGKAVGIFVASGPDAGMVEFSVDGKPSKTLDLFTRWSSRLHLPWAHVLETGLAASEPHCLELEVSAKRNPESTGNAVRVFHFLAN